MKRAVRALEAGQHVEAEKACRKALALSPGLPGALHLMGVILVRQGDLQQAIQYLRETIRNDPDYFPAYNDLGNALHKLQQLPEAISVFKSLNELTPNQPSVLNNLAVVLKDHGSIEEAVVALQQAIELDSQYYSAWLNLGFTLWKNQEHSRSIEAFEHAASHSPGNSAPLRVLAQAYRTIDDDEKALATYRRWIDVDPTCEIPLHMIAAFTTDQPPTRASDAFLREEFDRFADSFDEKLDALGYQVPQQVFELVSDKLGIPIASLNILDAGCGTGKVGRLLRPYAQKLTGVDVSSGMLASARRTSAYDELIEVELTSYLRQHPGSFDLITLVDTFIYFGELAEPLQACFESMKPNGNLVFSVETAAEVTTGYRLTKSGRYVHARQYLEECLTQAGFTRQEFTEVVLRAEGDIPVNGMLVWANSSC